MNKDGTQCRACAIGAQLEQATSFIYLELNITNDAECEAKICAKMNKGCRSCNCNPAYIRVADSGTAFRYEG